MEKCGFVPQTLLQDIGPSGLRDMPPLTRTPLHPLKAMPITITRTTIMKTNLFVKDGDGADFITMGNDCSRHLLDCY